MVTINSSKALERQLSITDVDPGNRSRVNESLQPARLPQFSFVAKGGPVCDPVRSITTKPNTDHDPHP